MNRRSFLNQIAFSGGAFLVHRRIPRTEHLIFIVNGGGARKKDYYENTLLAPNLRRMAKEGFVFEEDHCEAVSSHDAAFEELLQGRELGSNVRTYPSILDYIGRGCAASSITEIPQLMQHYRPRVLVCREMAPDAGHNSYENYLHAVKSTDNAIGMVFDWVKKHPDFGRNTAIVVRPEFGRDDEVNAHGSLHHSYGFYYTHRVASIFWGPDFNRGVDQKTVIN